MLTWLRLWHLFNANPERTALQVALERSRSIPIIQIQWHVDHTSRKKRRDSIVRSGRHGPLEVSSMNQDRHLAVHPAIAYMGLHPYGLSISTAFASHLIPARGRELLLAFSILCIVAINLSPLSPCPNLALSNLSVTAYRHDTVGSGP